MHRTISIFLTLTLLILLAPGVHAATTSVPDYYYPGYEAGASSLAFGGKPVSLLSGVESFDRTDLNIGSLYPISLSRRYNSRTSYDSPIGFGWAFGYDKRIYTYPDGSVTLRHENGWKKRFTLSGSSYISPVGETGTLVKNADNTFTFTEKSGNKENYDTFGRLSSILDAKGNSIAIYYELDTRSPLWGLLPANVNQTTPLIVAYDYRITRIEEKDSSGSLTNKYVMFHYDSSTGRLTDLVDSTGRTVTYGHDTIGNLTSVDSPTGGVTYGYTDTTNKHRITSIDEGNGAYVNTYDTTGRVITQTHGTGQITFTYTTPYQKTLMTTLIKDGSGNLLNTQTRTAEFDTNGQLIKVTDTLGNVTNYIRDSNMWITREEYLENIGTISAPTTTLRTAMNFTYDTKGNTLAKTEAQGTAIEKTTTWTYDPTYSRVLTETVKSVVNPAQNKVITNTYDSNTSNLLSVNEAGLLGDGTPYSSTSTYTYDSNGRILTIDGPRTDVSDITTYTYDVNGYLASTHQPIVGSTLYSNHDALGNPQTITDPNGNATTYAYDVNGRVLTVKAPGDTATTQYFYVSGGCSSCGGAGSNKIDHITLPEGNTIWYTYDNMGNLSTIKDDANNSINYTYDSEGNRLTEQIKDSGGALQKTLSYQYDALNRLAKIVNPDSTYTQYSYDFRGNKSAIRNPNSAITSYTYDALNRLTSTLQPLSASTLYTYDTNNNLTSVKDTNNNTTTYKFDDRKKLYQVISPDTGTTTNAYDPAGNLISKTDAKGVTISYVYDAANRLTKIDFPTDTDLVYVYDTCVNGNGRLCSMTDASGTTALEYTAKGQIKKETKTIDSIQYVTQYTYDQNGNLKTMTYPSGRVITYNYSNDRAVSVLNNAANLATNVGYKPFGGISSLTYGNGLAGSISYDNQYRVTSITAGAVMNLSYPTYDANGNITAINNVLDATKNKSFGYDALDRLSTATASGIWGNLAWTYDGVGNRQTEGSTVYSYAPATNKLTGAGGTSFGYDNNGNTTSQAACQYTYNQNQRLIQVVDGTMTAGYTFNGNGQRTKKTVNGTSTVFHYNLTGQLIAESNGSGATTAEYVYLNSQPLAKIEGTNTYFYHNDHLATPQKMTDSSGTVVWSADYKPFGEATVTGSTITNNLRFPGQYYDAETGLNYNYYRDYNPVLGRYIEADPIGIVMQYFLLSSRTSINNATNSTLEEINHLYMYAGANPINLADATGLRYYGPNSCSQKEKLVIAIESWAYSKVRMGIANVIGAFLRVPVFTIPPTPIPNWTLYTYDVYGMCVPECYIKTGEETSEWTRSPFGIFDYKYKQHNIFYGPKSGDPCCK
jgi:RHS repeat-associated protein